MQDAEGRTPLHYASAHDQHKIVKLLLDAKADIEKTDKLENTVLHYASGYGRIDIVELLLDAGASTTAVNHTGKDALELAKMNPKNPVLEQEDLVKRLEG
jgi:uncharacterized protein